MSISQPGRLLSGLLAGLESGLGLGLGCIYLGGVDPPKRIVLTTRAFPQTYFMHITVLVLLQASHPRQTPSRIQQREVREVGDLFHLSHCKHELSHLSRTHLSYWPPFFPSLLPDNTTTFNLLSSMTVNFQTTGPSLSLSPTSDVGPGYSPTSRGCVQQSVCS